MRNKLNYTLDATLYVILCVGMMVILGLCVLVTVNAPIISNEEEVQQSLDYNDYINFVEKEEECMK